jgi:cell division protein FtsI/penicillin-binding protein 2
VRTFEKRLRLVVLAFGVVIGAAALQALRVGVLDSSALTKAAATQQSQTAQVPAPRGDISDRNGMELAVSEPAVNVIADPMIISNPVALASKLAPLLGQDPQAILPKLSDRSRGFVYVARRVPASAGARIRSLRVNGLSFEASMLRAYPRGQQAGQLIGFVGNEGNGLSGLEYAYNSILRGTDGERTILSDGHGAAIQVSDRRQVKPGNGIRLTIDAAVQDQVERVLDGVGKTYQPKGATAIAMDPRDGSILAMANWPPVNANDVGSANPYAQMNRATGFVYEPGSTFKAITISGAVNDHTVTPNTVFDLPVELQVGDKTIHDAEDRGPESLPVSKILSQSSNVGAAKIGIKEGRSRFDHWVRTFGFAKPTHSGLPGEERGLVLHPAQYSAATLGNMSMGQGIGVTPLQMVQAYAAIANGGILHRPRIVAEVGGHPVPEAPSRRILSPATSASVRSMLRGVLGEGGTASGAAIPGFDLAGKTGTAQKVDPATGTYSDSKYIASFIGFAPASHPRLLVAIVVDEPQGEIYGGQVAAPAFSRIMAFALPYLGIPPH